MRIPSGSMQCFGGSYPEITRHPNGIFKEGLLIGLEETGGIGFWCGKMGSAISTCEQAMLGCAAGSSAYRDYKPQQIRGLQPELFFKMSHEIYNYGEGSLIGKVAADHSHKWVFKEPQDQEINFLSSWNNPAETHPRTWEAQFQSGIKTIALIAVREGVVQLGAVNKVHHHN